MSMSDSQKKISANLLKDAKECILFDVEAEYQNFNTVVKASSGNGMCFSNKVKHTKEKTK